MEIFKKSTPYEKSKEYLDKQQKIDLLLVLGKFLEPEMKVTKENVDDVNKRVSKLLDELK